MAFSRQNWSPLGGRTRERVGLGTMTAVVPYIGPWDERLVFADAMMGWPYFTGLLDDATPDGRGLSTVNSSRGVSAAVEPFGKCIKARADQYQGVAWLESYERAVVTITYELPGVGDPVPVEDDERGGGFISENFRPNAEFSTLDNDAFVWFDDTPGAAPLSDELKKVSEKEAPGQLFVGMDYIFTRHAVSSISGDTFTAVGHVNSVALKLVTPLLRHITFAPETVLYRGATLNRSVKPGETNMDPAETNMDLVMTFALRQVPGPEGKFYGWNHFPHAKVGKRLRLKRKSDGVIHLNHPLADLRTL